MNKDRRFQQIAAILVIVMIAAAVYIFKNGGVGTFQDSIDQSFDTSREGIIPLEISGFTPAMVTESEKPMLLVLGESWCQPCMRMMDDLRELHKSVEDVEVRYIDLESNPEATGFFPVGLVYCLLALLLPAGPESQCW